MITLYKDGLQIEVADFAASACERHGYARNKIVSSGSEVIEPEKEETPEIEKKGPGRPKKSD